MDRARAGAGATRPTVDGAGERDRVQPDLRSERVVDSRADPAAVAGAADEGSGGGAARDGVGRTGAFAFKVPQVQLNGCQQREVKAGAASSRRRDVAMREAWRGRYTIAQSIQHLPHFDRLR